MLVKFFSYIYTHCLCCLLFLFGFVGLLPDRVFSADCYPGHAVRINSYSKPKYLIDILHILDGMPELDTLLASPLGSLFSLPVRRCSLSGQLVHQMLCRQLDTTNSEEMWFVFGGQPLRFSLSEFREATGLECCPFPSQEKLDAATTHAEGSAPYWYTLIGGKLGSVTVKALLQMLKTQPNMPSWRKFRLALIVIVEGVLLCRSQPVKASAEVVEMVKDVDFFLKYPWGRHSFHRMLRMVKVGSYLEDADSLVAKLKQSSVAVHGFPLAIQLFALKYIPLLLTILPNGEDQSTFLDRIIHHLPKCKSFHTSNILRLEYSSNVRSYSMTISFFYFFLSVIPHHILYTLQLCVLHPQNPDPAFVASEHCDPKVKELERLIASSFQFTKDVWSGGDASLPSLTSSRKRKSIPSRSASSSSGPEDFCKQKKRVGHRSSVKIRGNADTLIEKHLKSFKASLLVELSHLIQHSHQNTRRGVPPVNKSSIVSPAVSSSPVRNTRSGCAGLSAGSFSKRSASNTRSSSSNAKHSPICHPAVGSAHTVLSPGKCPESMVDPEAVGFTGFQDLDTDVPPPEVKPTFYGSCTFDYNNISKFLPFFFFRFLLPLLLGATLLELQVLSPLVRLCFHVLL